MRKAVERLFSREKKRKSRFSKFRILRFFAELKIKDYLMRVKPAISVFEPESRFPAATCFSDLDFAIEKPASSVINFARKR